MANRPLTFVDYIGQERMKMQLRITMGACKKNNTPLPHMLISGNPGLGKTTIAKIIANEFDVGLHEVMASNLNSAEDVEAVLAPLSDDRPDILFIDEIHRLPLKIEELLYPVMEDRVLEVENGTGREKNICRLWVPKFTLIGATTLAGDLSRPLRDRFGLNFQLQNYQVDEVERIIAKLAEREETHIEREALYEIARRAKGVARLAINYYYRCKEYADFLIGDGKVTPEVASEQFTILGIDELGLDENDYRVLRFLSTQSRPVGVAGLATGCDIDRPTLENIIEPYLVQTGMLNRTRSGREITERGLNWIGEGTLPTIEDSTVRTTPQSGESAQRVGRR